MKKNYSNELEGQYDFYDSYLPLIDSSLTIDDIQKNNNDGQVSDVLIEMKLVISDLNSVVFQTIKYLSKLRIKGVPVPGTFLLIDLNNGIAYQYNSEDYREQIETVYFGGASKDNKGFIAKPYIEKWSFRESTLEQSKLISFLKDASKREKINNYNWFPVTIDVNNIVGWASTYYRTNKKATKSSFLGDKGIIGEIRVPEFLKGMIIPYRGETNIQFAYLMDKLNDNFQKKDLGAFFTPIQYSRKAHELVFDAIREHQKSDKLDYVIIDRCAGTGNLELDLNKNVPDDIMDKDILSHVILNTYEYYEYKVLLERLGDKVKYIVPPIETEETFMDGLVRGSNALSNEFIENEYIKQFIDDKQTTIIIFENPPYAETTSIQHQKAKKAKQSSLWKKDRGTLDAKEILRGAESNDLANVFIWTAINYYLREPEDSLIVFSPVKYWKNANWMNKKFDKGYAFNRKHFHTNNETVVSCIRWKSIETKNQDSISLEVWNIEDNTLKSEGLNVEVKRTKTKFSESYYDRRVFSDDVIDNLTINFKDSQRIPLAILNKKDGSQIDRNQTSIRAKAVFNENIIGYLMTKSNTFETPRLQTLLTRNGLYDANGFYLRKDNFLEKLPMFAAGWWSTYNDKWYLDGIIYRTGDGKEKFEKDAKNGQINSWLCKVLFYTSMEYYTKLRSTKGMDGRLYLNDLCLDNAKGNTLAFQTLLNNNFFENMNKTEKKILEIWDRILEYSKQTEEYNHNLNYGVFQIENELNTKSEVAQGTKVIKIPNYPELNSDLKSLRSIVKEYYREEILPLLFTYEFLK